MTTDITQQGIWSLSDLKKLEADQIMDRIEQIDNQAMLYKWRLFWALRQKFPSNIEFGHYLSALRERPHSPFIESQQVINRYIQAGRFAEQHKIGSLEQAGVKPSVIYLLSQPQNKGIADAVFSSIRRKNVLHKDVQVMLEQSRAVVTIEQQPELKAIEGEVICDEKFTPIFTQEAPAVAPSAEVAKQAVSRLMQSMIEDETPIQTISVENERLWELMREVSRMNNGGLSQELKLELYDLLDISFGDNELKLSELHNIKRNEYTKRVYRK